MEDKTNSTVSTAWGGLTEFTRSLLHHTEPIPLPSHVERSQDGQYLPADSIVNYAVVFNQLRNPGGAVGRWHLLLLETSIYSTLFVVICFIDFCSLPNTVWATASQVVRNTVLISPAFHGNVCRKIRYAFSLGTRILARSNVCTDGDKSLAMQSSLYWLWKLCKGRS